MRWASAKIWVSTSRCSVMDLVLRHGENQKLLEERSEDQTMPRREKLTLNHGDSHPKLKRGDSHDIEWRNPCWSMISTFFLMIF